MRAWWERQTGLQQWSYVTAGSMLALALLATTVWAAVVERTWLLDEWDQVQPNLAANLVWAPLAWLYTRWHIRRLHRKIDHLHRKVDQQQSGGDS